MYQLTDADWIWSRDCGEVSLRFLRGDRALNDMLRAHGYIMNGRVLYALDCLTVSNFSDALSGYRYYGLDVIASLLLRARSILETNENPGSCEQSLSRSYLSIIPTDSWLIQSFMAHLALNPSEYAPLLPSDRV